MERRVVMVWLAFVMAGCAAGMLAWRAQAWVGPALRRYREVYTQDAGVKLSELFLFIDPAQLWLAALACGCMAGLLAWAATQSLPAAVIAGLLATRAPGLLMKTLRRRRLERFERQLPAALMSLAGGLSAGASLAVALKHIVEQSEAPLSQEFGLMLREQRLGVPFAAALDNLHARVPSEATVLVVAALRVAAQTGGNLAEALERIAETLRARQMLQGKIRALTAQGRLQAWIVGSLPVLLGLALDSLEPQAMAVLWSTPLGWAVLAVVAVLETAGVLLIRRIVDIDI
jgi:tight adherence protein B